MTKELKDFLVHKAINCKSRQEEMLILNIWFGDWSNINDKSIYLFFDREQYTDNKEIKHGQEIKNN